MEELGGGRRRRRACPLLAHKRSPYTLLTREQHYWASRGSTGPHRRRKYENIDAAIGNWKDLQTPRSTAGGSSGHPPASHRPQHGPTSGGSQRNLHKKGASRPNTQPYRPTMSGRRFQKPCTVPFGPLAPPAGTVQQPTECGAFFSGRRGIAHAEGRGGPAKARSLQGKKECVRGNRKKELRTR